MNKEGMDEGSGVRACEMGPHGANHLLTDPGCEASGHDIVDQTKRGVGHHSRTTELGKQEHA